MQTTLLNYILTSQHGKRIAVIENEVSLTLLIVFCLKFSLCVIMGIHIVLTAEDVYPGGMHLPPVSAISKVAGLFSPTYGEHNYFKLIWISADCDSETWRSMERLILMARWWLPNNKETKTSSC